MNKIAKTVVSSVAVGVLALSLSGVVSAQGPNSASVGDCDNPRIEEQVRGQQDENRPAGRSDEQAAERTGRKSGSPQETVGDVEHEWITLVGTVTDADADGEIVVTTTDGDQVTVALGPVWYHADLLTLDEGDEINVYGFWEDGEFKAGEITLGQGETIVLRDADGHPAWAGSQSGASANAPSRSGSSMRANNAGRLPGQRQGTADGLGSGAGAETARSGRGGNRATGNGSSR